MKLFKANNRDSSQALFSVVESYNRALKESHAECGESQGGLETTSRKATEWLSANHREVVGGAAGLLAVVGGAILLRSKKMRNRKAA